MTVDPIPLGQLATALDLGASEHVAIVGGGGKTTTMYALAGQLAGPTLITTTTKMGHDQHRGLPVLLGPPTDEELTAALTSAGDPRFGPALVVWKSIDGTKAVGVDPADCDRWFTDVEGIDHVLVEADGARRRPFKAPGALEPVVPGSATVVIVVVGADALGRVIGDQCHRPLRVAALAGCRPFERLTPERAAAVLLHERGFVASVPRNARLAVVVTKVDEAVAPAVAELVDAVEVGRSSSSSPAVADLTTVAVAAAPR